MRIFILLDGTPPGKKIALECELTDTVEIIKTKIRDAEGIEPGQLLMFDDKQLDTDSRRLQYYSVQQDSTLQLIEGDAVRWTWRFHCL
jgi:hypothetical protein